MPAFKSIAFMDYFSINILGVFSYLVFLLISAFAGYYLGSRAGKMKIVSSLSLLGYALAGRKEANIFPSKSSVLLNGVERRDSAVFPFFFSCKTVCCYNR